jgi:hypothetical protein
MARPRPWASRVVGFATGSGVSQLVVVYPPLDAQGLTDVEHLGDDPVGRRIRVAWWGRKATHLRIDPCGHLDRGALFGMIHGVLHCATGLVRIRAGADVVATGGDIARGASASAGGAPGQKQERRQSDQAQGNAERQREGSSVIHGTPPFWGRQPAPGSPRHRSSGSGLLVRRPLHT